MFSGRKSLVLTLAALCTLFMLTGVPRVDVDDASAHSCGSEQLEAVNTTQLLQDQSDSPHIAYQEEEINSPWRYIDVLVVLPSEFSIDPLTQTPINKSKTELERDVRALIAHANQYLLPLKLSLRVKQFQIFLPGDQDPYLEKTLSNDGMEVLKAAADNYPSYEDLDYDLLLILGRGYYSGKFGFSYTGVSCTSKKYSVVFATQGGIGTVREYSFGQTIAHEVGHYLGMRHDSNEYSSGRSLMWPSYVKEPFGFSDSSLSMALSRTAPGYAGGACFSKIEVSDSEEIENEAAENTDSGTQSTGLPAPVYGLWNSFLNTINIVELTNPSFSDLWVRITLYSIDGSEIYSKAFIISAFDQFDLILNKLPEFIEESYGLIRIDFDQPFQGRTSYYRSAADNKGYEFAFSIPLLSPKLGKSAVGFNTHQPSLNPSEASNQVANWLSIVNLSNHETVYRVNTFDQAGDIILARTVAVPRLGRVDIDGGHGFGGPSAIGGHEILPENEQLPYIALLKRYGADVPAGQIPTAYNFAFPLIPQSFTGSEVFLPISTASTLANWLELGNSSNSNITLTLEFYSSTGEFMLTTPLDLRAHQQLHIDAGEILQQHNSERGYVRISGVNIGGLTSRTMSYYRQPDTGSISAMSAIQGQTASAAILSSTYNLFLGMENTLRLSNVSAGTVNAKITLQNLSGLIEVELSIPARSTRVLDLHDSALFSTSPDTYGPVRVQSDQPASLIGNILRTHWFGNELDFVMPTLLE